MRNVVFGGARCSGDLEVATTMNAHGGSHGRLDFESETFVVQNATRGKSQNGLGISNGEVAYTLDNASQHAVAFKASHFTRDKDGAPSEVVPPLSADADKGDQDMLIAFDVTGTPATNGGRSTEIHTPLRARAPGCSQHDTTTVVATVALRGREGGGTAELGDDVGLAVRASQGGGDKAHIKQGMQVRRLTPKECERLQGFPDDFTFVRYRGKPAADGPRYRAIGNAMCVPVVRWILERILVLE